MIESKYLFEDDSFSGVVILLDKNLNILKFNNNFKDLQGYTETDLYMKPFVDIIVPEDKTTFIDASFNVQRSKDFTIQCYHKQGAFRYFSFNLINLKEYILLFGNTIKKEFNSYVYKSESTNYLEKAYSNLDVDDISEMIIKDDKNMSMFLSMFPIDIWIKDRFNRYVFVNDIYTTHTGHTLDDVYLRDDFQLFPKDIAKGFTKSDKEAKDKRGKISYVFYASSNKLLTWTEVTKIPLYNVSKEYIGLLSFSSDVTESKDIEARLGSVISKYEHIFEKMNQLIFELNLEGFVEFVGGGLIRSLELNVEDILKKNILETDINPINKKEFDKACSGKENTIHKIMFGKDFKIELVPHYIDEKLNCIIALATLIEV